MTISSNLRHGSAALCLASLLCPAAMAALDTEPSWQGPAPLEALPDRQLVHDGRDACIHGKSRFFGLDSVRDPLQDSGRLYNRDEIDFTNYDVSYYDISIEVYQGSESLIGTTQMHFTSLVDGLDAISVHAGNNIGIDSALINGQTVSIENNTPEIRLTGFAPLDQGEEAVLTISYEATFSGGGVLSVWRTNVQSGQTIHTITTQSEPYDARRWWVCKDDTRDKADSMRIAITTNDFNTAVCNGVLESNVDHEDGTRTFQWFERWPVVTYLVSMCVTEYNHIETSWEYGDVSMPMHDWSWSLSTNDQQNVMQSGLYALDALSDRFGLYPFHDEKYGHAQYTWGGAMEHQTCSSMGFYSESVIAHELGHQWFGDKITCDTFHHIWLNEGWATYSEALYFEHYMGEEALHEYMTFEEYWGPGTIYVENPYTDNIFDSNLSYAKASWVVHMLRHVMGEEDFWQGVDAYLGPNEVEYHRTADTDEFQSFMENVNGDEYDWFIDQWIYGEYWPDYLYHWTAEPDGDEYLIDIAIIQDQVPERQLFTMPIDVLVTFEGGSEATYTLWNEFPAQSYTLNAAAMPVSVELDPDHWILRDVTELDSPPESNLILSNALILSSDMDVLERIPTGEDFTLRFSISNQGGATGATEIELVSELDAISFSNSPISLEGIGFGESLAIDFAGMAEPGTNGMAQFELNVMWDGDDFNEDFSWPVGAPDLLLIDDDGGDSYETWFLDAAEGIGGADLATPSSMPENLSDYGLVIWFTGDNRRELQSHEWEIFHNYVNGGGHFIFTGQHFAESQAGDTLMSHLGMELLDGEHSNTAVQGTPGGLFPGEFFFLFNGGAGNQESMDVISSVIDCSSPVAAYFNQTEGYAAEEFWCGDGSYMVFGFGLEGISDAGNGVKLDEAIATLYDWATGSTDVREQPALLPGHSIEIAGAWPNPFNPETRISYLLPEGGQLTAKIYNLAGQQVDQINPGRIHSGESSLVWRPEGLASGLYLAHLELVTQHGQRLQSPALKLMLMK